REGRIGIIEHGKSKKWQRRRKLIADHTAPSRPARLSRTPVTRSTGAAIRNRSFLVLNLATDSLCRFFNLPTLLLNGARRADSVRRIIIEVNGIPSLQAWRVDTFRGALRQSPGVRPCPKRTPPPSCSDTWAS